MFKELDGISTLGLKNTKTTGLDLWKEIWNLRYSKTTHFETDKTIKELAYENNFKKVDKRLEQFIGVYQLPVVANPYWVDDFIEEFTRFSTLENILISKQYKPANTTLTCAEFYDGIADLTSKLRSADYSEGMISVDEKRTMKIMKYIKQQLNKFVIISDTDFEKEEFVKLYMKMKDSKNCMYLILTNSIASILGMSSYAPDVKTNERGKLWTSCMSGHPNGQMSESVIANITDENSLLCYVTDGSTAKHMMFPEENKFEHNAMIIRTQVRILEIEKKPVLVVDRAYPNPMYTEAIYSTLAEITKETGVSIGIYQNYNTHQSGKNFFESAHSRIKKGCISGNGKMSNPVLTTLIIQNCSERNCKTDSCGYCNKSNKCAACSKASQCKKTKRCFGCEEYERADIQGQYYYDDQSSSRSRIGSDYGKFEQFSYAIYVGVENNIRKGE